MDTSEKSPCLFLLYPTNISTFECVTLTTGAFKFFTTGVSHQVDLTRASSVRVLSLIRLLPAHGCSLVLLFFSF